MSEQSVERTEDGRYIVVGGRRWRTTDPSIPSKLATELRTQLMAARRSVGSAQRNGSEADLRVARGKVQRAKVALGERGREWWSTPDPAALRGRVMATLATLLDARPDGSVCPSEVARAVLNSDWRALMATVRDVAIAMQRAEELEVTQRGQVVHPPLSGPIRLQRRA